MKQGAFYLIRASTIEYDIDEKGCFNCTSHRQATKLHYPVIYFEGNEIKITRFLWRYIKKDSRILKKNNFLLHSCDNRNCINLEHLRIGTAKENTLDAMKRNRMPIGEKSFRAKLSSKEVKYILEDKESTQKLLAEKFGVDPSNISYIKKGRSWKHISRREGIYGQEM